MTNSISQRLQAVQANVIEAEAQLKSLNGDLDGVNQELASLSEERQQYQLLGDICSSLDKLEEMGATELFWGEGNAGPAQQQQMERVRGIVADFQQQIGKIEESRDSIQKKIDKQVIQIEYLNDDLAELEEQEERAKYDYIVEREERELPYREMTMPWTKQGEDERRYRFILVFVFLFVLALNGLISVWELPIPDKDEVVEIPEHLVKVMEKKKVKPPKPKEKPKKEEKKKDEKKEDKKKETKDKPKPTPAEVKVAKEKASQSGVMKFSKSFESLLASSSDIESKLGATATLSKSGSKAKESGSRSLVMSGAKSTSGGIAAGSVSRGVAGGAGKKMGGGVSFSRVASAIGTDMIANDRPLSKGTGPSRTDEEIQMVFDRYKSALYRIYNRELRKDPSLRGKMVLRITIEPDGSVSFAKVQSTDMNSPELSSKIVARVKRFNFGPKDGVPKTTILYPIDFLPAS